MMTNESRLDTLERRTNQLFAPINTTDDLKGAIMKNKVIARMRERRNVRQFQRAFDGATPAVQRELNAMAARQEYTR
jgi:hypothetical protein